VGYWAQPAGRSFGQQSCNIQGSRLCFLQLRAAGLAVHTPTRIGPFTDSTTGTTIPRETTRNPTITRAKAFWGADDKSKGV